VEFRILGPLEVLDGGRLVDVGGQKHRALLAILLLHANEVVSVDRLIDDLWEEETPKTAAKALQVYVSGLRKEIGRDRLETVAPGYRLRIDADERDLDRFQRLVAEGRPGEALALWRGAPLSEFSHYRFAQPEVARLEELRLTAMHERIERDLEAGRHSALVGELEALTRTHPRHEGLRAQLILALYRSGRQSDALDAYQDARRTLDELGLEPGEELKQLEQRILRHDPGLDAPARPVAPAPPVAAEAERRVTEAVPTTEAPKRRLRAVVLAAGAALLLAAAGAVALVSARGSDEAEAVGNAIAAVTGDGSVSYTDSGRRPSTIAVGEGAVWVLNADDRTISRLDPESNELRTFGTGGIPTDLAVGEGAVWVGNGVAAAGRLFGDQYTSSISRLDPGSAALRETAKLPPPPRFGAHSGEQRNPGVSQLAAGAGAVWVINPDLSVSRLNRVTGRVEARIDVKAAGAIAAGEEGVWVLSNEGAEVIEIDPAKDRLGRRISLEAGYLWALAVGAGSVWATDAFTGVLWRITPGEPVPRPIDVGPGLAAAVAYGAGAVWVTILDRDELVRVDPETNKVTDRVPLAGTPPSVAADDTGAWVSVAGVPAGDTLPASACGPVEAAGKEPDVLIASGLPLQGPSAPVIGVVADAIRFVLRREGYRAGPFTVGYQSCDDSTAQTGGTEFLKCQSNAKAYAATTRLVGVIGAFLSRCSQDQVPITNSAPGPLAMISPSNTHPGLTHRAPGSDSGEPAQYYPTGARNYVRVTGPTDLDAAAGAKLADELMLQRVYVVQSTAEFGRATATPFKRAARNLGVNVVGSAKWNHEAADYRRLAARVAAARPDGVYVAGAWFENGGEVVKALRARLGHRVVLIGGDWFQSPVDLLDVAGPAAIGMYTTTTAVAHKGLSRAGRKFVRDFGGTLPGGVVPNIIYVTEAAAAAEALLAAIAASDGTRASVNEELRRLEVDDGILGPFRFDQYGDITPAAFTVLRITGGNGRPPGALETHKGSVVDRVIRVNSSLARP
jgi:DNA-binding SARP family transcriptional activator/ABC-type branched-subunit amino acid transport system substrate-binding protein/streptogramin lyase